MVRPVASEDEEPDRSVLSCAPPPGLARGTAFPGSAASDHPLSALAHTAPIPLAGTFVFPTFQSPILHILCHLCLGHGWHGKSNLALKEANHRKNETQQSCKPLPKGCSDQVEVLQEQWKGIPILPEE